jgi:Holliday junction resolvase
VGAVAQAHEEKLRLLAEYKEENGGDPHIPARQEYKGVKFGDWLRNTKASTTNRKRTSPEPWILERLRDLGVKWACDAATESV